MQVNFKVDFKYCLCKFWWIPRSPKLFLQISVIDSYEMTSIWDENGENNGCFSKVFTTITRLKSEILTCSFHTSPLWLKHASSLKCNQIRHWSDSSNSVSEYILVHQLAIGQWWTWFMDGLKYLIYFAVTLCTMHYFSCCPCPWTFCAWRIFLIACVFPGGLEFYVSHICSDSQLSLKCSVLLWHLLPDCFVSFETFLENLWASVLLSYRPYPVSPRLLRCGHPFRAPASSLGTSAAHPAKSPSWPTWAPCCTSVQEANDLPPSQQATCPALTWAWCQVTPVLTKPPCTQLLPAIHLHYYLTPFHQ